MNKAYDLIIIGSGPAGLSAAIYATRAQLNTLVLEKEVMSGGQVLNTYEVDNYPGLQGINGFDLGMKFREHADTLGAQFAEDAVQAIVPLGEAEYSEEKELIAAEVSEHLEVESNSELESSRIYEKGYQIIGENDTYQTKSIILATGATHRKLGVEGEERLVGQGVSYCATCDGAFFRGKTVAVVGGGDVALEDAIFLARICEKVYLIHRRDAFRGAVVLQKRVMETPNIEILWDTVVDEIEGQSRVEQIQIRNVKTEEKTALPVQGIFVAVGIVPNTQAFKGFVDMDKQGYILAGEDGKTSQEGVFVAGDARTKMLRQIITAASDGANCVTSVEQYLTAQW